MQLDSGTVGPVVRISMCKVCNEPAPLYGVTDVNKSCEERRGRYLPLTGVPVYYHRCDACGLIFTTAFDHWGKAAFILDFIKKGHEFRCLDYGGGNGRLTSLLREGGVDGHSWDPMDEEAVPPSGSFDFISAFEVLEHTPEPLATVQEALGLLNERGVLLFSTLTIDHVPPRGMDNWYIAPRNGHITLYTRRSLQTMFAGLGYRIHHFNDNLHMALKDVPEWLT